MKPGKKTLLVLAGLSGTLPGCMSMNNQSTLDAIQGAMNQPIVEAYIEYPGPQEKWAGPASFVLHITAKDAGPAQIAVAPALFTGKTGRKIASNSNAPSPAITVTGETARAQLSNLVNNLQGAEQSFRGCLSPVRLRLVRADGSILEKQGCRSQNGWSRAASETVNYFIAATVPATAPAAATAQIPATPATTERAPASAEVKSAQPAAREVPPTKDPRTGKKNI